MNTGRRGRRHRHPGRRNRGIGPGSNLGGGKVERVYGDASALEHARKATVASGVEGEPESLESLLSRDLKAWNEAKAAIARAKGG